MKHCDGSGFHYDGTECRGCEECDPLDDDLWDDDEEWDDDLYDEEDL